MTDEIKIGDEVWVRGKVDFVYENTDPIVVFRFRGGTRGILVDAADVREAHCVAASRAELQSLAGVVKHIDKRVIELESMFGAYPSSEGDEPQPAPYTPFWYLE